MLPMYKLTEFSAVSDEWRHGLFLAAPLHGTVWKKFYMPPRFERE